MYVKYEDTLGDKYSYVTLRHAGIEVSLENIDIKEGDSNSIHFIDITDKINKNEDSSLRDYYMPVCVDVNSGSWTLHTYVKQINRYYGMLYSDYYCNIEVSDGVWDIKYYYSTSTSTYSTYYLLLEDGFTVLSDKYNNISFNIECLEDIGDIKLDLEVRVIIRENGIVYRKYYIQDVGKETKYASVVIPGECYVEAIVVNKPKNIELIDGEKIYLGERNKMGFYAKDQDEWWNFNIPITIRIDSTDKVAKFTPSIYKELLNIENSDKKYKFRLYYTGAENDINEEYVNGEEIECTVNDKMTFSDIIFEKEGIYLFYIEEIEDMPKEDYVEYDKHRWYFTVNVEEQDGNLVII